MRVLPLLSRLSLPVGERPLPSAKGHRAFTLIELLVVMGIMVVLIAITGPVITSLKSSGDVTKTIYDLAGILEQSRAYAMSNNTYVYVGLAEVDVTLASSVTPQKAGNGSFGRLSIAVAATKDGTQGNVQNWTTAYPTFKSNLIIVGKPMVFDNVHVPDLGDPPKAAASPAPSSGMVRPTLPASSSTGVSYSLGSKSCISATPFDYPLSAALDKGQYSFKKVIQFDPQGVARIQTTTNSTSIAPYMEIGLQQTHGPTFNTLPAFPTSGNIAAIQIDGITGGIRIYRP
jgi:prepilin-type N-terminal cleavage/methylation domain-containing protein